MGNLNYRTLRENIADVIRARILNNNYTSGMRIVEQEIADEFQVSRGPIREALRQLEQEGFVEYTRNVGCSVKKLTSEDMFEAYIIRGTYELIAVKSFKGGIPDAALKEMENTLELIKHASANDYNVMSQNDNKFHRIVIQASGLSRLLKSWDDLDYVSMFSFYTSSVDSKVITKRQYAVHKEIYDIYCTNDLPAICSTIAKHYEGTLKRYIKERNLSPDDFKFSMNILDMFKAFI